MYNECCSFGHIVQPADRQIVTVSLAGPREICMGQRSSSEKYCLHPGPSKVHSTVNVLLALVFTSLVIMTPYCCQ